MPVTAAQPSDAAATSSPGDGHPTPAAAPAHATTGDSGGRPWPSSAATFGAFVEAGSPAIRIRSAANGKSGEIEIYGDLDDYGFRKDHFNREMRQLKDAEHITIRINSDGGNAFDGFYIHDALRNHPARITTRVDNMAASAASIIMMAGDDREIAENGWVMIHNTWGDAHGQAEDFERYAGLMRKMNGNAAEIYAARTGMSVEEIVKMMDDETWMKSKEALDGNFATRILAPISIAAKFDLSRHHNVPEAARTALGLETAMTDPKNKPKNVDGSDATPADANTDQPNAAETAVAEAAKGFFAQIANALKPQAAVKEDTGPVPIVDPKLVTKDTPNVDIEATVNAAVERQFAALLSADSPVVQGLGAAFSASIAPIVTRLDALNTRVAADDAAHRQFAIESRLNALVTAGHLTPSLAKTTRVFLAAHGASLTDEAITAYFDDLAKSAPLNLATAAIGPVEDDAGNPIELPAELNPPPGSNMTIRDTGGLRVVAAARAKAEEGGGTAEQKYNRMREELYRVSGEGRGRSSLAFQDSPN